MFICILVQFYIQKAVVFIQRCFFSILIRFCSTDVFSLTTKNSPSYDVILWNIFLVVLFRNFRGIAGSIWDPSL